MRDITMTTGFINAKSKKGAVAAAKRINNNPQSKVKVRVGSIKYQGIYVDNSNRRIKAYRVSTKRK